MKRVTVEHTRVVKRDKERRMRVLHVVRAHGASGDMRAKAHSFRVALEWARGMYGGLASAAGLGFWR
jgi:hypothetical protein